LQNRQIVLHPSWYYWLSCLITFAGFPQLGIVRDIFVTTDPAPITHPFPIVILGQITELPPIQQSSPIVMGKALSSVFLFRHLVGEWPCTINPEQNTLEPIVTLVQSKTTQFTLKKTLSPQWML
jgi:hypothetical protein